MTQPTRHIDLPPDVVAAGSARNFVRETLNDWGYDGFEPSASLAVSELVTNAVLHAQSATRVILVDIDRGVQLRVWDDEHGHPRVQHAEDGDIHGRGMMLVESVAEAWGVEQCPTGKVVWLDITEP